MFFSSPVFLESALSEVPLEPLGHGLGFRGLGFRGLGFRGLGVWGSGFRGLGV